MLNTFICSLFDNMPKLFKPKHSHKNVTPCCCLQSQLNRLAGFSKKVVAFQIDMHVYVILAASNVS